MKRFLSIFFVVMCVFFVGQANLAVAGLNSPVTFAPDASSSNVSSSAVTEAIPDRRPITTKRGIYYFVKQGERFDVIAERYKISPDDLAQINQIQNPDDMVAGRRLFIPQLKYREEYLKITSIINDNSALTSKESASGSTEIAKFEWPLKGYVLTSKYGWRRRRNHAGIDLSAKPGTPIYSASAGTVIFAERYAGYGNLVVVKHAGGYYTAYAHAQSIHVHVNQRVKMGQEIATVGNTGRSTGPHLHFEVRKNSQSIDPLMVLPKLQ